MPEPLRYGIITQGTKAENLERFSGFLKDAKCITRNEASTNHKHRFKTAQEIHVIAIGCGSVNNGKINESITAKQAIEQAIDEIKKLSEIFGVDNKTKKITKFRLQVCYQGVRVTELFRREERLKDEIVKELEKSGAEREIEFSCPRKYSHIENGEYIDSNTTSRAEFLEKRHLENFQADFSVIQRVPAAAHRRAR